VDTATVGGTETLLLRFFAGFSTLSVTAFSSSRASVAKALSHLAEVFWQKLNTHRDLDLLIQKGKEIAHHDKDGPWQSLDHFPHPSFEILLGRELCR
jgi:hypothetical protein